jgi:hypothetical protein
VEAKDIAHLINFGDRDKTFSTAHCIRPQVDLKALPSRVVYVIRNRVCSSNPPSHSRLKSTLFTMTIL